MAPNNKWSRNVVAAIAALAVCSWTPAANAQDPIEAIVGVGLGVAMGAMDMLSQGAAIRGSSDTDVGFMGQTFNEKLNGETGFGQAIQQPNMDRRRRRNVLQQAAMEKENFQTSVAPRHKRAPCGRGQGRPSTTRAPDTEDNPRQRREIPMTEHQKRLSLFTRTAAQRGPPPSAGEGENEGDEETKGGGKGGKGNKGGKGKGGGGGRGPKNKGEPRENSSTPASTPERKRRDVNEQSVEQLRMAAKRLMEAAQALAEGVRQAFAASEGNGNENVEIVDV